MKTSKDLNEYRAVSLGYVYFSRLDNLIINEPNEGYNLFNYWIDIGDDDKPTGRFFAVEAKPYDSRKKSAKLVTNEYKYLTIPAVLVLFDNNNDRGYYTWIKKPATNGDLVFNPVKGNVADLNNVSLHSIVAEIKDWYSRKQIA